MTKFSFRLQKGSNPKSDEWNMSATQNLWGISFIRILVR
eukprot:UN15306